MQAALSRKTSDSPPSLQRKRKDSGLQLKIAGSKGAHEAEADRVADGFLMRSARNKDSSIQMKPSPVSMKMMNGAGSAGLQKMEMEQEKPEYEKMEIYRKAETVMNAGDHTFATENLSRRIDQTRGSGEKLDSQIGDEMHDHTGHSFSNINVHTGLDAAEMNNELNSRAFATGSDIYFNSGEYRPDTTEGRHLIAHELTHTVQQGAAKKDPEPVIQRSVFGRVGSAIGSRVRGAAEWAGDRLSDGLKWLRNKLASMVSDLPGYGLFTVFLGRDPIADKRVERSGFNFIEQGLEIIPNGREYKQKLAEEGALEEAAAWLDEELTALDLDPGEIMENFRNFWGSLGISDVRNPGNVFDRLLSMFRGPVNRLIRFARNLAGKFLEIVKNYLLSKLREFTVERESPTWYPLLTVILGYDPIMAEEVDRSGERILDGFVRLHPEGDEQLQQMKETGSYGRAVEWIEEAIVRIQNIAGGLQSAFQNAWAKVTDIHLLLDPRGTFEEIYADFRTPVVELIRFAGEVAATILRFIKDALLRRLTEYARNTWGYPLLTVLLGRDPFTRDVVERTPKNLIRGFMLLLPGGEEKFNRLDETGAIDRMTAWIGGAVDDLNITMTYIRGLFTELWRSFSLQDLANPLGAFQRIVNTFAEPIGRISAFMWEVIKALVMFGLEVMNFPFQIIRSIVDNAMQAYQDIRRDPVGFFLNLMTAVKEGFAQFFSNITSHLLGGLRTWLFGELGKAGITPPEDLSFMSIFGFILDVLGITLSNIWARLREKLGPERAEQLEAMAERATGAWAFVKDLMVRGPIALWEYIRERLSNLWSMVMEHIRNWVVTRIIQRVTARLLSMLDPTGIMAVVNGFITFFKAIQSFIEKLREMLQIVATFVEGVASVAKGVIRQAANYLERALSDGVPVVISFLANQVGLSGLGRRVGEMIEAIRERVNAGIDWLIDRAMAAGSALMEMGRSAVGSFRDWWSQRKQVLMQDGSRHEIYFSGSGANSEIMMASTPQPLEHAIDQLVAKHSSPEATQKLDEIRGHIRTINELKRDPESGTDLGMSQQAGNRIGEELDAIARLLRSEAFGEDSVLPPSVINWTTATKAGGPVGESMVAEPLSLDSGGHRGSQPQASGSSRLWEKVNRRKMNYVQGHLLNHHVHGPGKLENLVPITRSLNTQMEKDVESKIKNEVLGCKKVVKFEVRAVFGNHPQRIYVPEESELPTALSFDARYMEKKNDRKGDDPNDWAVAGTISGVPGSLANRLPPDSPADIYPVMVDLNKAPVSEIVTIPGIGAVLAEKIVQARQEQDSGRFHTYQQLSIYVRGLGEGRLEQLRQYRWVKLGY